MTVTTAEAELSAALERAGLDPAALDPWQAWKGFKAFLRRELEGGYDAAGVQIAKDESDPTRCSLSFIRQLSARDVGGYDAPFWSLVVEFHYHSSAFLPLDEVDVWTLDYPTLEEFASVVEGMPAFQAAVAATPIFSEVFAEDL